jgi:hypothetical protein
MRRASAATSAAASATASGTSAAAESAARIRSSRPASPAGRRIASSTGA